MRVEPFHAYLPPGLPQTIADDFNPRKFAARTVVTGTHCFGCTAGAGSSCGGAVAVAR